MSNKHVLIYCLFCLVQIPFYLTQGWWQLGFDTQASRLESLLKQPANEAKIKAMDEGIDELEETLNNLPDRDSRWARLELVMALSEWSKGDAAKADAYFRRTIETYVENHGPDSFHVHAVRLRHAEYMMLHQRYLDALPTFETSLRPVREYVGPKHRFVIRMLFRQVAILTFLGRRGEAARLARPNMEALAKEIGRMDVGFVAQTGAVLDMLALDGKLPRPPNGWKDKLQTLHLEKEGEVDAGDADVARK